MRYVLIADDHEITRRGVRESLQDAFDDLEIHEASDGTTVLARLDEREWTALVLDIMMPGPGILDLVARIRAQRPALPILVLTALTEVEYILQTLKAGANGVIHKHRAAEELVGAFEQVARGETYLHAESGAAIAAALREEKLPAPHESLSPRELEIFKRIAVGLALKEIASELSLSDKTVATYLARIREKTGLTSYVEIARYALRVGLVE